MRPIELSKAIQFAIANKMPILIKGSPGIGKSDIVEQACRNANAELIVSHPVVSDPTDFKGLPFPNKNGESATFLPFGDLLKLINADKPTVFFLDDLGQAPSSVQASCMQLILARRINGHKVSEHVIFLAATNRRQDKAGVTGILEPVKSRFAAIVELEVNVQDWVDWAIENNMPTELISFIRYRPALLNDFHPTGDIINTPCPRTVANIGKMINAGLDANLHYEMFMGAAGEGFAAEFLAFLTMLKELPDIDTLLNNPLITDVPERPDMIYAICGALSHKASPTTFDNIMLYVTRLPKEFQVLVVRDSVKRNKSVTSTSSFTKWALDNADIVL
jgi:hypothetical protein